MAFKNLWNDDSVFLLLREYKKLKESYSIRRSSSMPKKGWEAIKKKLHAAGYTDIRHQHVVKKFASLKLHYKEFREGLPVKQRVYGFVDLLSEILDDDPYIAFAKPTKRMKEKRMFENKDSKDDADTENYITLEFSHIDSGEQVTQVISGLDSENIGGQFIDASILLTDDPVDNHIEKQNPGKVKKPGKIRKEFVKEEDDLPGMPSWISYLVDLLRKEEQQRADHLWRLHENICQAEKVKVDMLERLINSINSTTGGTLIVEKPETKKKMTTELVLPDNKPNTMRNIIIVDEEGSIYLKPSELRKRKREQVEYTLAPAAKVMKQPQVEFLEADSIIEAPQLQLQLLGDGDEIIIENCEDSEIYKVEPVYEEELDESNVISHVEIVEEQVSEEEVVEHQINAIEFIQPVSDHE